jgi:hypothetical protein
MATTLPMNSTALVITLEGAAIAHGTGVELSINHDVRDVSTKASGGNRELLEGRRSWSATCEALYVPGGAAGWSTIWAAWLARTQLTMVFGSAVVGDKTYTGEVYVGNGTLSGPGRHRCYH